MCDSLQTARNLGNAGGRLRHVSLYRTRVFTKEFRAPIAGTAKKAPIAHCHLTGQRKFRNTMHVKAVVATPGTQSGAQYFTSDRRPVVLFDGVCNLCNGGVNTALRFDRKGALRFAALQSGAGKELLKRSGRSPEDISSIVLVEPDSSHIKSEAILRIGRYLELPFPVLVQFGFPFPLFFRDTIYDQVANSRYQVFGRSTVCRMKEQDQLDRFLE